eukprot:TRINITY_DN15143_c0_g1_i1.p1 TRINITY_DN15143_c0_g1~~TRINITY_DN15143_c0_g1_i1.p1  ORF type:complete len:478 (+),score=120.93 TRINITY_DN15143_c0_g1_i1:139-1572(+)
MTFQLEFNLMTLAVNSISMEGYRGLAAWLDRERLREHSDEGNPPPIVEHQSIVAETLPIWSDEDVLNRFVNNSEKTDTERDDLMLTQPSNPTPLDEVPSVPQSTNELGNTRPVMDPRIRSMYVARVNPTPENPEIKIKRSIPPPPTTPRPPRPPAFHRNASSPKLTRRSSKRSSRSQALIELPGEPSAFWISIFEFVEEYSKDLGPKEPTLLFKQAWNAGWRVIANLRDLLMEARETREESELLRQCQYYAAHPDCDKRLRVIIERVHRKETEIHRVVNFQQVLKAHKQQTSDLKDQIASLILERDDAYERLRLQEHKIFSHKHNVKEIHEQFGGVIMRSIVFKEIEMEEAFQQRLKNMTEDFEKRFEMETQLKQMDVDLLRREVDSLKLKNVEWIQQQTRLLDEMDRLQKENERWMASSTKMMKEFEMMQCANQELKARVAELEREVIKKHSSSDVKVADDVETRWRNFLSSAQKK